MNKIIFILAMSLNLVYAIGLKSLVIPQSALVLGSSNIGIGDNLSSEINPSSLIEINPYLGFSRNIWLGDVDGQRISMMWNRKMNSHLSFESLNVKDIELRNKVANDEPLGFFGAYWYAIDFSRGLDLKKIFPKFESLQVGYKIKFNLSKLYTESMYGVTFDLGIRKKINDRLFFGLVLKNFGKEIDKNLTVDTPEIFGIGIAYEIPRIHLKILTDVVKQEEHLLKKVGIQTNFKHVNLLAGTTESSKYSDFSYGLQVKIKEWSIIYGNLIHNNSVLGNPISIELRKNF